MDDDILALANSTDLDILTRALRASKAPGPVSYWFCNLADIIDDLRVQRDLAEEALAPEVEADPWGNS